MTSTLRQDVNFVEKEKTAQVKSFAAFSV